MTRSLQNHEKGVSEMIQITKPLKLICIGNNTNNIVFKVKDQSMQETENLKYLIRELELDK